MARGIEKITKGRPMHLAVFAKSVIMGRIWFERGKGSDDTRLEAQKEIRERYFSRCQGPSLASGC